MPSTSKRNASALHLLSARQVQTAGELGGNHMDDSWLEDEVRRGGPPLDTNVPNLWPSLTAFMPAAMFA